MVTGSAAVRRLLTAALLAGGVSLAQDHPPPLTSPQEDPVVVDGDFDEVAEALRTLDAAQVPPTNDELALFLEEAGQAVSLVKSEGHPLALAGSVLVRSGHYQNEGLDHYGKFVLESRWLRGRARIRQYRYGLEEATGTIEVWGDPVEMKVGDLGLVQGYGLLCGAPGRGQSLTADSGLGPRTERMVTWLGPPDTRTVKGIGLQARYRSWRLRWMGGHRTALPAGAQPGEKISVVQVGWNRNNFRISAAGLQEYRSRGASLAGGWNHRSIFGSFETLAWRAAPGIPITGAAVLRLRWGIGRAAGLEGQWGFADLASAPGLASRPGVLPGWSGQGYVLRGFLRAGPGMDVRALVHLAQNLDRVGVRNKYRKALVDLQVTKKWSPRFDLAVRCRSSGTQSWSWSERYPWLPPEAGRPQQRTILSAKITGKWSGLRAGCLVRTYGMDALSGPGRRSLFNISAGYNPGGNWKLRGAWVTAWGDPVDLVSAIVPVAGMVLPRHWGAWRSETVLGAEWSNRRARMQGAGSWRQPEGQARIGAVLTLWLEAGFRW
jgi:hypothetical protein